MKKKFQYLYGPVYSWRLGMSFGIDPISQSEKICNYNCTYCQLGETHILTRERKIYVPTDELLREIAQVDTEGLDYLTFSGRGEPTLALNLGEMISKIKELRSEPIAVITNGGLLDDRQLRQDLYQADCVLVKLDACDPGVFENMNSPAKGSDFDRILHGIYQFRKEYHGKMCLQIMFVETNRDKAAQIAERIRSLGADEVELNTPLRRCQDHPLSEQEMKEIKKYFDGICGVTMVYERTRRQVHSNEDKSVRDRHGRERKDAA